MACAYAPGKKPLWSLMYFLVLLFAADADVKKTLKSEVGDNVTLCFSSCDGNLLLTFSSTQDQNLKVLSCAQGKCTAGDLFKNRVNVDWNSSGKFCVNLSSIKYNDDSWFESTCDSKEPEWITLEVIDLSPNRVDALIKSNISIPCYSRTSKEASHDNVNFYWDKDGDKVLYVEKGITTYGEGYENRTSVVLDHYKDGNLFLTLRSITTSDQGKYLCHTTAGKQLGHPGAINLTVKAPDADEKKHLVSEVGDNVTFCFSSCDGNLLLTLSSIQDENLKVLSCSQRKCTAGDLFKNRVNVDWNSSGKFCVNLSSIKYNDDGWFESTCDSKEPESILLEVIAPIHVDALFKSNISIPCYSRTSKLGSYVNFYWDKDGQKVLNVEKGKITYGEGYENRASVVLDHYKDGNLFLTLRSITTSDQGRYLCHTTAGKNLGHPGAFALTVKAHFKDWLKNPGEVLEMDLFDSDDMYVTFTAASTKTETHVCNVNRGKPSCSPAYTKRVSVINNTLFLKSLSSEDAGNFTIKDNEDEVISVHKVSVTEGGDYRWIGCVVVLGVFFQVIVVCAYVWKCYLNVRELCIFTTSTEPSFLSVSPAEERMPVDKKCTSSVQVISPVAECVPLEEQHTLLKQDVTME